MTDAIQVIHGPNLNLLGRRNPDIYGILTLDTLNNLILQQAKGLQLDVTITQSNHEGEIIDQIQKALVTTRGLVINPGGFTHTSVALADAIEAYPHPCIEVHLSNIYSREEYRRHSYISPHVDGVICGLGPKSYLFALDALRGLLDQKRQGAI